MSTAGGSFFARDDDKSKFDPQTLNQKAWKILVIDDDQEVLEVTELVLRKFSFQNKGLTLLSASSGKEAKQIIKTHPDIAVILLDVVMETDDSGLALVEYIRNDLGNQLVQIILRTGQPGYAPEEKVIFDYGINAYGLKTDLTAQKLVSILVTALRSYHNILRIEAAREELDRTSLNLQQEINRREKAEEALIAHSEKLEEMVEVRTQALKEAQAHLVRQEKLAILGQLSGGVAHELRNPLGVISNAIYFLKMIMSNDDEVVNEYLNIIASRVGEAERIVTALLYASRTHTRLIAKQSLSLS